MADDTPTSGTPAPPADDTDAAPAASGTPPDPEGADAGSSQEGLVQEWKRRAEQAAEIRRRNEELEREIAELRGTRTGQFVPPTADPRIQQQQAETQQLQHTITALQYSDDPRDQILYRLAQQQLMDRMAMLSELQLQQVPGGERADVQKEFATGRYADVEAAHHAVLGRKYRVEQSHLERERATLKEAADARKAGVVATGRTPVSSADMKAAKERSRVEVHAEIDALYAEGRAADARALARKMRSGEITLT